MDSTLIETGVSFATPLVKEGWDNPDHRLSMGISVGENGEIAYANDPNDPMPIKTINMAGLQKWEETYDYIIYLDKDAIVTTVQNYVPGTFDLYNERKSQIEAHAEILKMYEVEWTPEDSEKLLLDVNNAQLERIASTPTTMDEPTEIQTFSARAVPTTYECCFRTDKKTGEIYIGEGYENLFYNIAEKNSTWGMTGKNLGFDNNGFQSVEMNGANTHNDKATICLQARNTLEGTFCYKFEFERSNYLVGIGGTNVVAQSDSEGTFVATATGWSVNLMGYKDGIYKEDVAKVKIQITKTSTPKPFVRSLMPESKLVLPTIEDLGEIVSKDGEVIQHENGTVIVDTPVYDENMPDNRISMGIHVGANGEIIYKNNPNDPMPIKTINMAGLQKWEETDDYIIYVDKDAVMTTVQQYVTGTYDLFLERKANVDGAIELLKDNGIEWTAEDDSKLLQDINLVQLEKMVSMPTTMEEDFEPKTLESITVPSTYECCFRTDKKTGEIYIGEGYENLVVENIFGNIWNPETVELTRLGRGEVKFTVIKENDNALTGGYTYARTLGFDIGDNATHYAEIIDGDLTSNSWGILSLGISKNGNLTDNKKIHVTRDITDLSANYFSLTFSIKNSVSTSITIRNQITKTSTPKPFVKSVMPAGKLAFVTDATEETHTFVSDLVPSEFYGVCFTETDGNSTTAEFKVERLGQAVGKGFTSKVVGLDDLGGEITEIQSDFDNCYPWSEMKRVIVDNDLNIVSRFGDANYDPTLSSNGFAPHTHTVMRFTPECYVKRIVLDLSEPYGEKWQQTIICVSKHPLGGYEKHDAFLSVNADGTISENKGSLINAYEATCVNKLTGIPVFADVNDQTVRNENDFQLGKNGLTNYSDYFLTSYDARNKQAPTSSATMSNARIMTESRNTEKKITGLTYHAHELDMCLFAVEFASLNGQKILGDGISSVNDTPNTANNSATVGYTSALGNKSGSVQIVNLMRGNNIPVSTQRAVSYRGRENPFGNIWKYLEGTKTGTSGKVKFGIYNPHTSNNYADYNANSFVKQAETEQVFMGNSNGYWRVFGHRKSLFIPSAIKNGTIYHGSSSGCRVGDYVWYHTGGGKIAMVGGIWNYAGNCGFGCSHWYFAFTSLVRNAGFGLSAHCKEVS